MKLNPFEASILAMLAIKSPGSEELFHLGKVSGIREIPDEFINISRFDFEIKQ